MDRSRGRDSMEQRYTIDREPDREVNIKRREEKQKKGQW